MLIKLTVYIKLSIHVVIDDKSISNSCIPSLLVVIKEFSTIYPLISTKVQIPWKVIDPINKRFWNSFPHEQQICNLDLEQVKKLHFIWYF